MGHLAGGTTSAVARRGVAAVAETREINSAQWPALPPVALHDVAWIGVARIHTVLLIVWPGVR